jgi:hypothetical protein
MATAHCSVSLARTSASSPPNGLETAHSNLSRRQRNDGLEHEALRIVIHIHPSAQVGDNALDQDGAEV